MNLGLILFIAVVALFMGGIFLFNKIFPNFSRDNLGGFLIILWGFGLFGSAMATHQIYSASIEYYEEEHEYYIHSLGNDKYIKGSFGLFTGNIDQIDYYFFYVNYVSGMGREKLPTSNTYLVEGNYRPVVKSVHKKYKDDDRFWKVWNDGVKYYKMYVPKNTIIRDFKVR